MEANREYKASVFTLLFNDKERLLELYNALNGTDYTDKENISINILQNALFMDRGTTCRLSSARRLLR